MAIASWQGLTDCCSGRFDIQRMVTCQIPLGVKPFEQRKDWERRLGSVLEQASPRSSDPATVGSVFAPTTFQ